MGLTAKIAFILNQNIFTLLILIVLLVGIRSAIFIIQKYKNALTVNCVSLNNKNSINNIVPGLFGLVITFIILIMLLIVGHLYNGLLTDAELIFAIIVVGFYGILFANLVWLTTKMVCVSPSQNAYFPGSYVQTESGSSR